MCISGGSTWYEVANLPTLMGNLSLTLNQMGIPAKTKGSFGGGDGEFAEIFR